jgi:hypothetical protein
VSSFLHFPKRTELLKYHERMLGALRAVDRQFVDVTVRPKTGFTGLPRVEFDEALRLLHEELDAQVTMMVIASAEAVLKRDFRRRLLQKDRKDPLWIAIDLLDKAEQSAGQMRGPRITPLLKMWSKATDKPLSNVTKLFKLRNWLAHGRHFSHGSGVPVDPLQASVILDDLDRILKMAQPNFPLS